MGRKEEAVKRQQNELTLWLQKLKKKTAEVWKLLVYKTVYLDMWLKNSKGSYYSFFPKLFLSIFSFSVHYNGKKTFKANKPISNY